jgi:1-acyl-sn-glycerol-3-phosphate acyltransferase
LIESSSTDTSDPRDLKTYYFHLTATRRILDPTLRAVFRLMGVIYATGVEKFPSSGPVVVAANHLTTFDVFPLQFALPRPLFYMGKEELFRNPLMDWLLRHLGGFPVVRGAKDEWAVKHSEKILEKGLVLGIFPEGTRSRGKGLKPAKTGAARLAQAVNCPIVPVALHGTQYMFRKFPHRTIVQVSIGDPIHPEPDDTHLELTDRMMFALAEMLPPESRGVYRHRPTGF